MKARRWPKLTLAQQQVRRDGFIRDALKGLLSRPGSPERFEIVAHNAVGYADAAIAEADKEPPK